jgi:DNA mismatch repair protein MutS2
MSSSGQTAFIEPLETINLNNDLVRLRELEQTEIIKVLFAITEELRDERDALRTMATQLSGRLISSQRKPAWRIAHDAIEPAINQNARLHLKDARHPLLEANLRKQKRLPIVPLSLDLDAEHRVMVISGPNAGGKTVVLKTVGLAQLDGAGRVARASDGRGFADLESGSWPTLAINQSIAANLSTFTAHLQNIRKISDDLESLRP